MANKETIAELLRDVEAKGFWRYSSGDDGHDMTADDIADYLTENGAAIIVHCKDCNSWKKTSMDCGWCEAWDGMRYHNHFCNYGERRTNG